MEKITRLSLLFAFVLLAASCGNASKKERVSVLNDKKSELLKLKSEKATIDGKVKALEIEIAKLDTGSGKIAKSKLVAWISVVQENFSHYIDLQGKVDAQNISYITPRGQGGQVRALYIKEGDNVRKGQLIAKLDDALARQGVAAARQSMGSVRNQLDLAKSVYQRQKNLWDQNIGTEVQLLQAKTNVESLESQLRAMGENVKLAQEQVSQSNVYANVSGVAEEVNIHVGETFVPGAPLIKIVNTSNLKVVTNVPENYLSKVRKGTPIEIVVPDINKKYSSSISLISASIDASSRGFVAEARIPADAVLKPNQIALVRILDYSSPNAIVVPLNTLQTDEKGKFVLVASKEGEKMMARKRAVQIGEFYSDKIEIRQGLKIGDLVIT
ncbi:MAG: efflux RND transporter periplasmic adaptor subunit, partial [Chitinophagaceae bacterium]